MKYCRTSLNCHDHLEETEDIVELQWLEHLWNHENMFETGVVRVLSDNHSARSDGYLFDFLEHEGMFYFHIRIASVYHFQYKKITLTYLQQTQERVRNSREKRAISVRVTEGLL